MSGHTPGPWRVLPVEKNKPYLRIRGTQLGFRYKIANVIAAEYDLSDGRKTAETCANARLIAAAPELLGALQAFVDDGETLGIADRPLFLQARSAISKATGGQQ